MKELRENTKNAGMTTRKQAYILLQCHSCGTYQVHIDKKSRKFVCPICHVKQAFSRVFARSAKASDCRALCSRYNRQGGASEPAPSATPTCVAAVEKFDSNGRHLIEKDGIEMEVQVGVQQESLFSGWEEFLCHEDDASRRPVEHLDHDQLNKRLAGKESIWKENARDNALLLCTQPVERKQRCQKRVRQESRVGDPQHGWDKRPQLSKVNEDDPWTKQDGHKDGMNTCSRSVGQGKTAWFAEFLD